MTTTRTVSCTIPAGNIVACHPNALMLERAEGELNSRPRNGPEVW